MNVKVGIVFGGAEEGERKGRFLKWLKVKVVVSVAETGFFSSLYFNSTAMDFQSHLMSPIFVFCAKLHVLTLSLS